MGLFTAEARRRESLPQIGAARQSRNQKKHLPLRHGDTEKTQKPTVKSKPQHRETPERAESGRKKGMQDYKTKGEILRGMT
jgi:hypothetical protein